MFTDFGQIRSEQIEGLIKGLKRYNLRSKKVAYNEQ